MLSGLCGRSCRAVDRLRLNLPSALLFGSRRVDAFPSPRSYKGFDEDAGIEVAWNKVKLRNVEEKAREQLQTEVLLLGKLDHENIIHCYGSWTTTKEESADMCINFITELCSNTLRK